MGSLVSIQLAHTTIAPPQRVVVVRVVANEYIESHYSIQPSLDVKVCRFPAPGRQWIPFPERGLDVSGFSSPRIVATRSRSSPFSSRFSV